MLQWHTWSIFCQLFLICSALSTLVVAFWSVFSFMKSSGSYFWRWMQWVVLTCVMQFHDQFEIIIPLINSWISLFVSAILELCLGWMWKPFASFSGQCQSDLFLLWFLYRSLVNVTSNKGIKFAKNPHVNFKMCICNSVPFWLGVCSTMVLGITDFYVCSLNQKCSATTHSALLEFHLVHQLLIYRQVSSIGEKQFPGIGWHF